MAYRFAMTCLVLAPICLVLFVATKTSLPDVADTAATLFLLTATVGLAVLLVDVARSYLRRVAS